jgi:hypothetical protein
MTTRSHDCHTCHTIETTIRHDTIRIYVFSSTGSIPRALTRRRAEGFGPRPRKSIRKVISRQCCRASCRVPTIGRFQISTRFVLDERGARRSPSSAMASAWRDIQDEEEDDEDDAHVEVRSSLAFGNARISKREGCPEEGNRPRGTPRGATTARRDVLPRHP